ncbi:PREDICTED: cytochrome b561 domain-containing protein 2-like [Rhagoletis zephyria]|uniref:cytochrome b561 domain-containing protein 2-like n=1 Tax=Rhagoletis zephyria TaxID=28612 RepID=UPI0008114051|nr:PREDICTED: cytochrome b561 domain-containing protein 2-like [Rhagoletis zephyria]
MTRRGKFVVNKVSNAKIIFIRDSTEAPQAQCQSTSSIPAQTGCSRRVPPPLTLTQKLEFVLTLINRLLIGFITIYLCWMSLRLDREHIPWHAVLCTLGFLCLMSEGLMAYYRGNVWTQICQRPEKARLHWMLQLCGAIIGLTGIVIKMCLEEVHFHTLHGILGLATMIVLFISLLSGLGSLYATELKSRVQPRVNKTLHNITGLITYTLAMLSMYFSFETALFNDYSLDASTYVDFRLLLEIITVIIFALSTYGPLWCLFYSRI